MQPGDCILADLGFTIAERLVSGGATLKIPHSTKGKTQMLGKEVVLLEKYQMYAYMFRERERESHWSIKKV